MNEIQDDFWRAALLATLTGSAMDTLEDHEIDEMVKRAKRIANKAMNARDNRLKTMAKDKAGKKPEVTQ